jgi:hypothetical protein
VVEGDRPVDPYNMTEEEFIKAHDKEVEEHRKRLRQLDILSEDDKLLEIWKVLEALTVSLNRIGWYWHFHGEEAAKDALHRYLDTDMWNKIADARYLTVWLLEAHNRSIETRLEEMSASGKEIKYWNGPLADQS